MYLPDLLFSLVPDWDLGKSFFSADFTLGFCLHVLVQD
jgi:hypothetical protein